MQPERRVRLSVIPTDQRDRFDGANMGYDYRRESAHGFDATLDALEDALQRHGFTSVVVRDLQATLASKGFNIKPIHIYEVGAASGPSPRGAEMPGVGDARFRRLLPCRINVFVEDESVVVTALRPTLLCRVFPDESLEDVAAALETVLVTVVDETVR